VNFKTGSSHNEKTEITNNERTNEKIIEKSSVNETQQVNKKNSVSFDPKDLKK